jgi:hypothetical protein
MDAALSIAALVIALVSAAAAVYAVAIGRQGLAWRKRQDMARVTPSVRVDVGHAAQPRRELLWTQADMEDERPVPLVYELTVNVVNTGETTERIRRVRIEAADHSEGSDLMIDDDHELQPRARFPCTVLLAEIPKWESGFVAIATLADGEDVSSAVENADDDLLAHIEEHNQTARP